MIVFLDIQKKWMSVLVLLKQHILQISAKRILGLVLRKSISQSQTWFGSNWSICLFWWQRRQFFSFFFFFLTWLLSAILKILDFVIPRQPSQFLFSENVLRLGGVMGKNHMCLDFLPNSSKWSFFVNIFQPKFFYLPALKFRKNCLFIYFFFLNFLFWIVS